MRTRRLREAIFSAIVAALLVMGLCNGAAIVAATWFSFPHIGDISSTPFTFTTEENLLWFLLVLGAIGAVFGFFSTLNKP